MDFFKNRFDDIKSWNRKYVIKHSPKKAALADWKKSSSLDDDDDDCCRVDVVKSS